MELMQSTQAKSTTEATYIRDYQPSQVAALGPRLKHLRTAAPSALVTLHYVSSRSTTFFFLPSVDSIFSFSSLMIHDEPCGSTRRSLCDMDSEMSNAGSGS